MRIRPSTLGDSKYIMFTLLVTGFFFLFSMDYIYAAESTASVIQIFPSEDYKSIRSPAFITVKFSEPLQDSSVSTSTFTVKNSGGSSISGSVTMILRNGTHDPSYAKFTPQAPLKANETYTVHLDGFKDSAGKNVLPYEWSFSIMDPSKVTVTQGSGSQGSPPPHTAAPPNVTPTEDTDRDHRNSSVCDDFASVPIERDTDGDKIPDVWEVCGIDVDRDGEIDLDLKGLGANPSRKDIFVEVDYMEHHKPIDKAIRDVVLSFGGANIYSNHVTEGSQPERGIALHVLVDEEIPHENIFIWDDRSETKKEFFGTHAERQSDNAKNIIAAKGIFYHYALFVHSQEGTTSSGRGEIKGNDFIVSLGSDGWAQDSSRHHVGSYDQQSGTFMHELGHNLGLLHGGSDSFQYKPNYMSVMNYNFQMSSKINDRPLDYSRCKAGILFEESLSEKNGIKFNCPRQEQLRSYITSLNEIIFSGSSVDYNGDGDSADRVIKDLNNDTRPSPYENTGDDYYWTLSGNNDWSNIKFYLWYTPAWFNENKWNTRTIFSGGEPSTTFNGPEYTTQNLLNDRLSLLQGINNKLKELSIPSASTDPTTSFRMNESSKRELTSSVANISNLLKTNELDSAINELSGLKEKVQSSMSVTGNIPETLEKSQQELDFLISNFIEVLKKQQ